MTRHETSVVIHRPIDEVWAFLNDPFHMPRFATDLLAGRQTSPGPRGLGSTGPLRVVVLGFETRMSATITEWDPPHAFTVSLKGGGLRSASGRHTLEAATDGTKVMGVFELEPGPILMLLWPIAGPFFMRRLDATLQNLKRLLEAGGG